MEITATGITLILIIIALCIYINVSNKEYDRKLKPWIQRYDAEKEAEAAILERKRNIMDARHRVFMSGNMEAVEEIGPPRFDLSKEKYDRLMALGATGGGTGGRDETLPD